LSVPFIINVITFVVDIIAVVVKSLFRISSSLDEMEECFAHEPEGDQDQEKEENDPEDASDS
jgi:hypothetical protein